MNGLAVSMVLRATKYFPLCKRGTEGDFLSVPRRLDRKSPLFQRGESSSWNSLPSYILRVLHDD